MASPTLKYTRPPCTWVKVLAFILPLPPPPVSGVIPTPLIVNGVAFGDYPPHLPTPHCLPSPSSHTEPVVDRCRLRCIDPITKRRLRSSFSEPFGPLLAIQKLWRSLIYAQRRRSIVTPLPPFKFSTVSLAEFFFLCFFFSLLFCQSNWIESFLVKMKKSIEMIFKYSSLLEDEEDDGDFRMAIGIIFNEDFWRPSWGSQFGHIHINQDKAEGHA